MLSPKGKPPILRGLFACIFSIVLGLAGMAQAQTQPSNNIYLPMFQSDGPPSNPQPTPTPEPTPSPEPTPDPNPNPTPNPAQGQAGLFLNRAIAHTSADVAIDGQGGMHAAYAYYVPTAQNPRAVYTFCLAGAAACAQPTAWQSVELGERVREVQLDLTAAGLPRLLIVSDEVGRDGIEHAYAACDAACSEPASWTITRIVTTYNATDILDTDEPQRSFAISPQGKPAFIVSNRDYFYSEPDKYGAYYHSCEENCADAENWRSANLSRIYRGTYRFDYEVFRYPVLTFTEGGEPRLAARVFALNEDGSAAPSGLYYYSCATDCHLAESWQRVFLISTGDGASPYPSWDLDLSDGRPRIALFTGYGFSPDEYNYRLLYLYCDSGCLDEQNWYLNRVLTTQRSGKSASIKIDGQGHPRLAWIDEAGDLGYAWCNTSCETDDQAAWQQRIVEREEDLRREFPQAIPLTCDTDAWNGHAPVLALDAAGNPRIAYDVAVKARCSYDDTPGDPSDPLTYRFESIWRGVHLAYFPQP